MSWPWWSLFFFYFGLFSLFSLIAYQTLLQTGSYSLIMFNNSFRVRYEAVYPNNLYPYLKLHHKSWFLSEDSPDHSGSRVSSASKLLCSYYRFDILDVRIFYCLYFSMCWNVNALMAVNILTLQEAHNGLGHCIGLSRYLENICWLITDCYDKGKIKWHSKLTIIC